MILVSLIFYIKKYFGFYLFYLPDGRGKPVHSRKNIFTFKNLIYCCCMLGKLYNSHYPTAYEIKNEQREKENVLLKENHLQHHELVFTCRLPVSSCFSLSILFFLKEKYVEARICWCPHSLLSSCICRNLIFIKSLRTIEIGLFKCFWTSASITFFSVLTGFS